MERIHEIDHIEKARSLAYRKVTASIDMLRIACTSHKQHVLQDHAERVLNELIKIHDSLNPSTFYPTK